MSATMNATTNATTTASAVSSPEVPYLPENASLPVRLKVAWGTLKILQKDPGNPIAGPLLNASLDGGVYTALSAKLRETPEGRTLLTERPSLQGSELDLKALAKLPAGTLGQAFAQYFEDNRIEPFESPFEVRNDVDYLSKRYRETHDIAHVLTGYRTDVMGEMELQAFMLGNLHIRTAALILMFSLVESGPKKHGLSRREYARRLWAAFRRGTQSPQLIRFRYERHWEQPVTEVRALLGIPAAAMTAQPMPNSRAMSA